MFLFSSVGHLSLKNFVSWYTLDIDHSKHPIFTYFYLEEYCTGLEFQCEGLVVGPRKPSLFLLDGSLSLPAGHTSLAVCFLPCVYLV